jgi:hypothetical protein
MKNIRLIIPALALFLLPFTVFCQSGMEDVIYLKNGSIYRGVIIEQVPNVSMKIRSAGGNVFAVQMDEVERIAKEDVIAQRTAGQDSPWPGRHGRGWMGAMRDTTFSVRQRGFFLHSQILLENVQGGVRLISGYKAGRFGYFGIGIGMDRVFSSPANERVNGFEKRALAGLYLPLYLYHARDMHSNRRFTPFYAIEGGYAMAWEGIDGEFAQDASGRRPKGGPIGGVGLGFRMYPRQGRGHFSLLFNVNFKRVDYERDVNVFDSSGQVTGTFVGEGKANLIFPGVRLGFGF